VRGTKGLQIQKRAPARPAMMPHIIVTLNGARFVGTLTA